MRVRDNAIVGVFFECCCCPDAWVRLSIRRLEMTKPSRKLLPKYSRASQLQLNLRPPATDETAGHAVPPHASAINGGSGRHCQAGHCACRPPRRPIGECPRAGPTTRLRQDAGCLQEEEQERHSQEVGCEANWRYVELEFARLRKGTGGC